MTVRTVSVSKLDTEGVVETALEVGDEESVESDRGEELTGVEAVTVVVNTLVNMLVEADESLSPEEGDGVTLETTVVTDPVTDVKLGSTLVNVTVETADDAVAGTE